MVVFDPHAQRPGRGVASGVSAADPASRTTYVAGEIAQCDFWFPDIGGAGRVRADPHRHAATGADHGVWVIRGGASAVLVPTRTGEDLYAGWWGHLSALGAVPRVLVWDGEGAVGRWGGARNPN